LAGFLLILGVVFAATAGAHVYWSDQSKGTIGRANLDGSGFDPDFIHVPGTGEPVPIGVAVSSTHIYWVTAESEDPKTGVISPATISRANLDGSGIQQSFIEGELGDNPAWLAVNGSHVYWASAGGGGIYRANLDGSNREQLLPDSFLGFNGLAVSSSHIYWSWLLGDAKIGRADLDGSEVEEEFMTGLGQTSALAVDADHLYWTNWPSLIGRANLDGGERDENFIPDTDGDGRGLAVDSQHIFWGVEGNPIASIGRANIDGSNRNPALITPLSFLGGLAVDASYTPPPNPLPASPPAAIPSTKFKIGRFLAGSKPPTLLVGVPGPGVLELWGANVKRQSKRTLGQERARIPVVFSSSSRHRRKTSPVAVTIKVSFTATDGSRRVQGKRIPVPAQ
jgi:hypothetical protein